MSAQLPGLGTERGVEARRNARLASMRPKYRKMFNRAWTGQSRKAAIRAFCLECVGYSESEVSLCTAPACALFEYREKG